MRPVLTIIGLILIAAGLAAGVGARPELTEVASSEWVRTVDGWEPYSTLFEKPPFEPRLHPAIVAAVQLLASLWALLALPPRR